MTTLVENHLRHRVATRTHSQRRRKCDLDSAANLPDLLMNGHKGDRHGSPAVNSYDQSYLMDKHSVRDSTENYKYSSKDSKNSSVKDLEAAASNLMIKPNDRMFSWVMEQWRINGKQRFFLVNLREGSFTM